MKKKSKFKLRYLSVTVFILSQMGCAALFGWNIHAPGVLSQAFYPKVNTVKQRIALFLPERTLNFISTNRGGKLADPQTYYVGESFTPMVIEGFQTAFEEFVFMETEPTPELLKKYSIPYLIIVNAKNLGNDVTMKGQKVDLMSEVQIYDQNAKLLTQFEAVGASDAKKIFAKKGGPEVNLNAAIENNIAVSIQMIQDFIRNRESS